ncbi:hypothetical protein HRbin39_01436 [bacterium HR39]|nr:hypothetical protein HRbin39_01436 [bacterium HR39]
MPHPDAGRPQPSPLSPGSGVRSDRPAGHASGRRAGRWTGAAGLPVRSGHPTAARTGPAASSPRPTGLGHSTAVRRGPRTGVPLGSRIAPHPAPPPGSRAREGAPRSRTDRAAAGAARHPHGTRPEEDGTTRRDGRGPNTMPPRARNAAPSTERAICRTSRSSALFSFPGRSRFRNDSPPSSADGGEGAATRRIRRPSSTTPTVARKCQDPVNRCRTWSATANSVRGAAAGRTGSHRPCGPRCATPHPWQSPSFVRHPVLFRPLPPAFTLSQRLPAIIRGWWGRYGRPMEARALLHYPEYDRKTSRFRKARPVRKAVANRTGNAAFVPHPVFLSLRFTFS